MASRKGSTPRSSTASLYARFIARLRQIGATAFCPACYAWTFPDHVHGGAVAVEPRKAA